MRYLNKIIYINSASVKYAEIELDGNVHFIGNQGSGKTTLLRAVLLFYNANKIKLGIGREKKRFDDYYFEYQNSYIIYEVQRDNSSYCVLAYKVNGKVAFRFIDAAYKKEIFINQEGKAYESWERIRHKLGRNIHYSRVINNYEEYRQIIYGDNKGLKPEFRKYSIIESKQYQNIPRTIQNVFLNSKLEAQFIKETIINSISDDVFKIDLENYSKNHLRGFETQINDVKIWSETNKKGQIVIRNQADKAIENYRVLNFLKREKIKLTKQLSNRIQYIEQHKPEIISNFKIEEQKLNDIKKRLDNLAKLYHKHEQDIISDIKVLKRKIDEAKQKLTEYKNKNIDSLIEKVAQKDNLEKEKNRLEEEKTLLESKFSQIKEKYEALIKQQENILEKFKNEKNAEYNSFKNEISDKKIDLSEKSNNKIESVRKDYEKQIEVLKDKLEGLLQKENLLKQQKAELKHKIFFKNEIEDLQTEISKLKTVNEKLKIKKQNAVNEIKNIRKEWELETKEIERQTNLSIKEKQKGIDKVQIRIKDITNKIEQSKSSFYGWLNDNMHDWEHTIGKIIDEGILYKTGLNPRQIETNSKSLFGVDINLEIIDRSVKTVSELQAEIDNFNDRIKTLNKGINALNEDKLSGLNKLKIKFGNKINKLKDAISDDEYQADQNDRKTKKLSLTLSELHEKSELEKTNKLNSIEEELEHISVKKLESTQEKKRLEEQERRKISRLKNEKENELNQLQLLLDEKGKDIEQEKDNYSQKINERIREIEKQRLSEMENKGADTERIQELNKQLFSVNQELSFIKENEVMVIEYNKDKRELFDNVPEFKSQILNLENKEKELYLKNKTEKEKLENKHRIQGDKLKEIENIIDEFENDITAFDKFKISEVYKNIEQNIVSFDNAEQNQTKAISIIDELKEKYYNIIHTISEIRRAVNIFVGNFNEDNIFKFRTRFNNDNEYIEFVAALKEFVEEDKIAEFEKRVNERFANIIFLIARETNDLMSKEAEIEKIIKKINNDFLNKNFVEAIKEMEIRTQQSSNSIVQILNQIKVFNDKNSLLLGNNNLFTTQDSDSKNRKAIELLKQLIKELERHKSPFLTLSDSFDLQFRIVENDNDTGWVENLSNVGSEGTDILVKAMVNILLLNVFKESASKKFNDFKLHCMMDEIGRLHPVNVKGILRFANERNILLINGSPTSQNAMDYRYTYKLSKEKSSTNNKYITRVKKLIKVQ